MKYNSVVIFVSDMEKAKSFYTSILDLRIDMDMGNYVILENEICLWKPAEDHIIPKTIGLNKMMKKGNDFELYFVTEDLESIYNRLRQNNARFLHKLHEEPWGQNTVRIFDPDNNIIEIGEKMETFVGRMHNDGFSIDEIAKKTGMKKEDIKRVLGSTTAY